jgi:hypothetical protein
VSPSTRAIIALLPIFLTASRADADELVDAARARQDAARTLQVDLKIKMEYPKRVQLPEKKGIIQGRPEGVEVEFANRILIDGAKARYEDNIPLWFPGKGFEKHQSIGVSDGTIIWSIDSFARNGQEVVGTIEHASRLRFGERFVPISVTFRSLEPTLKPFALSDLRATGNTLTIDGWRCAGYILAPKEEQLYWLDPSNDFILRRHQFMRGGRVNSQLDVQYKRTSDSLVPSSWTSMSFDGVGKPYLIRRNEVVKLVINQPIAPAEFELRFPPGSLVEDQRDKKHYRVQADGSMHEVGPDGQELDSKKAVPADKPFDWKLIWIVVGFGAVGLFVLFLSRRRRSRSPLTRNP